MKKINSRFQIPDSNQGFTLIEAVVATALFAFVVSSIIGVYISTIQLDRKTRALRTVAQNARFISEYLAKEVRNGTIDYGSYSGGLVSGANDLYLEDQTNTIEHIYLNGTDLFLDKNGVSTNLNTATTQITNLKFYVSPIGDPYTSTKNYNEQPHVTMLLEVTSNYGTNNSAKIDLEDTYTTRTYPARQ